MARHVDLTRRLLCATLGVGLPVAACAHGSLRGRPTALNPPDYTVTTAAELQTAWTAAGAAGGNKTIMLKNGGAVEYGTSPITLSIIAPAGPVTIYAEHPLGARLPGLSLIGSSNFVINDVDFFFAWTGATLGIVTLSDATHAGANGTFNRCRFASTSLQSFDYRGSVTATGGAGAFIDGEFVTAGAATGVYRAAGSTSTVFTISGRHTLATDPFAVGVGSAVVTVTDPAHGIAPNAQVTFAGAAAVGGITPNGTFQVTWIDPNTYSFVFTSPATSTATGGGAAVQVAPDDQSGNFTSAVFGIGATLTGLTSGATRTITAVSSSPQFHIGVYAPTDGTGSIGFANLTVNACVFHDLKWPIAGNGPNWIVQNNNYDDMYISFGNYAFGMDNLLLSGNEGINVWAKDTDGQPGGHNGPHSSLLGISTENHNVPGMTFRNEFAAGGAQRALTIGGQGFANGPKFNDIPNEVTATIDNGSGGSGNLLTISSTLAAGTINTSDRVFDSDVNLPYGLHITGQVSGPAGGAPGVYTLSASALMASSATAQVSATLSGGSVTNCMYIVNGVAFQFTSTGTFILAYNTLISDTTTNPAAGQSSLQIGQNAAGNKIHHNICGGFAITDTPFLVDPSNYSASGVNTICTEDATSGPASRQAMFAGNGTADPFAITATTTVADMKAMFALKPGSSAAGRGATVPYASYTAAGPTTPSGAAFGTVGFDGSTTYDRYTKGGSALLDITDPSKLLIVIDAAMLNDNDAYVLNATNSVIWVRRLPSGSVRLTLRSTTTVACLSMDTSLTWSYADGRCAWLFSVDLTNYKVSVARGPLKDPFANITVFTGQPIITSVSQIALGATPSGGTKANMDLSTAYITDEYGDLEDAAFWNRFVAQDGKLISFGANGSLLTGTQPRAFLQSAVPATWNAGGGYNLGSAAQKFIMVGAVN